MRGARGAALLLPLLLLLLLLLLLAAPIAAGDEDGPELVRSVRTDVRKSIRKALEGNGKALAKVRAVGPLSKRAAEEVEKKVLHAWPFSRIKGGRREIEIGGRKQVYALHVPKGYSPKKAWPLLISLHGAGGNGPGELGRSWPGTLDDFRGFVAAPSGNPPGAQWFPEQVPFVLGVIREVMESASIDANRVYVNGFSNGGNGAWYYATYHPGLFAAMCTRGGGAPNPGLLVNLRNLPAFIIHGENDPTIRVDSDRANAKKLGELGYVVDYHEIAGGSHRPFTNLNEEVLAFFAKHPRDPFPKRITFRPPDANRHRLLWLEVPAGAGAGQIEGEVAGNTVALTGVRSAVLWLADGLVDLDEEVVVTLDGTEAFRGRAERRLTVLLDDLRERFDRQSPAWARVEVKR